VVEEEEREGILGSEANLGFNRVWVFFFFFFLIESESGGWVLFIFNHV
jgi:hypothetical protein